MYKNVIIKIIPAIIACFHGLFYAGKKMFICLY
jgi:hypothetical protein